jgi:hypothetical protein
MTSFTRLELLVDGTGTITCTINSLIIAGWSGRDRAAVEAYVASRAPRAFKAPSRIPSYYRAAPALLTQAPCIDVLGSQTSGEAEVVLVSTDAGVLVGIGSDHTDREAAPQSVSRAKQLCAKPIGSRFWRYENVVPHWDQLELTGDVEEDGNTVCYQSGHLDAIMHPREMLADLPGGLPPGTVLYCGTLPVIGTIRPAASFRIRLRDPILGGSLTHHYETRVLPVVD